MHDAGQVVFTTITTIQEIARHETRRSGLVSVAALGLETVTLMHDMLPFRTVRAWPLSLFPGPPVNDQMCDFMGDRLLKEGFEVFSQQFKIDPKKGLTVALDPCLSRTASTQREIDHGLG